MPTFTHSNHYQIHNHNQLFSNSNLIAPWAETVSEPLPSFFWLLANKHSPSR